MVINHLLIGMILKVLDGCDGWMGLGDGFFIDPVLRTRDQFKVQ